MMAVEQYYKVGEAAKLLSTSRFTIHRWIEDGTLPATDINPSSTGRAHFRIAFSDLQTLIERLKENTCKRSRRKASDAAAVAPVKPVVEKGKRKSVGGEKLPKVTKSFV
jgi:excisionase family DNA binding protein